MTFERAYLIALLVVAMQEIGSTGATVIEKAALSGLLYLGIRFIWNLFEDPLPGAIRKGLEEFAKDYRR